MYNRLPFTTAKKEVFIKFKTIFYKELATKQSFEPVVFGKNKQRTFL